MNAIAAQMAQAATNLLAALEPDQGHHYIIQGSFFLIEYDNTQDGADHVHTIWRDLENDFGDDLLRRHYEQQHRK